MDTFTIDCHGCKTKHVGAKIYAMQPFKNFAEKWLWNVFVMCNVCQTASIVVAETRGISCTARWADIRHAEVVAIFPKIEIRGAPRHVPANQESLFAQSAASLADGRWDAVPMLCRRILDMATREKGETNGRLVTRIDALGAKQVLTPALVEWAHQIRIDGNEGEHGNELTAPDDAQTILDFTEMFLMYVYTLPGMLAERRAKIVKP